MPPDSPTGPNRPVITATGFGGGFMLRLAVLVMLELLNSAVRRPQDIQSALGVDVMSTITYIQSPGEIRRRRTKLILGVLVLVVAIPAAIWFVDQALRPLEPLVGDLITRFIPA